MATNQNLGRGPLRYFSASEIQMAERINHIYVETKTLSRSEKRALAKYRDFLTNEVLDHAFGPPIKPQKQPRTMQQLWQKARGQLNRAKLWADRKVEDLDARPFGNYDDPKEIAVRRVVKVMRRLGFGE